MKNWILTGDTHGRVTARLDNIRRNMSDYKPEETAVIILGDAGINYYLNKSDKKNKHQICDRGYTVYCVRGNHEERPENVEGMKLVYDEDVHGWVYQEAAFPLIKYFVDGGEYNINGHSCLVIGGAYSVDKYWRLASAQGSFSGWFEDEQLTDEEKESIARKVAGKDYDFVFTHTCPYSWEPTDLFIGCVDQTTVDQSTEIWLEEISRSIKWRTWCFGHFHDDRIERPCVEQFYYQYVDMETIWNRWYGECTFQLEKDMLNKSPSMYYFMVEERKGICHHYG
jgi:3-oxoacid CoA-transferase subunit A